MPAASHQREAVRRPVARRMPATTEISLQARRACRGAASAAIQVIHSELRLMADTPVPPRCDRGRVVTTIVPEGRGLSQALSHLTTVSSGKVQSNREIHNFFRFILTP